MGKLAVAAVLALMTFGPPALAQQRGSPPFARAVDVKVDEVYRAQQRPGYACWVTLWHDTRGGVYLSFIEKRRGENKLWEPLPLDFWESTGLPHGYHTAFGGGSRDVLYEFVVLKSSDDGVHWKEIGRSPSRSESSFSWTSLPDGRILRSLCNDYYSWRSGEDMLTWSEVSSDGGSHWKRLADIFEGHNGSGSPHRLRRLSDGTLVQLGTVMSSWGPGRERARRHIDRAYVRQELMPSLFFSENKGQKWSPPLPVLFGVLAYEPDVIELRSGDLLLLNSTVQGGPQVRQVVCKTRFGWFPQPVFDVVSGRVPETVVLTRSGLLVGAVRGGEYSCSNDEGASWHKIEGLPAAGYQPYITELSDGRLLCAWHGGGGDMAVGEADLYVGTHTFRLEANLPKPTQLTIQREKDPSGSRYINVYRLKLTAGGQAVANRSIHYRVKKREGQYTEPPGTIQAAVTTDEQGQARLDLESTFARETNKHLSYGLEAWFEPGKSDLGLNPCKADSYFSYVVTTSKKDLGWD